MATRGGMAVEDEDAAELQQLVRSILLEKFLTEDAIAEIQVKLDEDHNGDEIYRIAIVLQPGKERIDGKLVGLVRHLRSRMRSEAFPIISFLSKSDAAKLKRAAG